MTNLERQQVIIEQIREHGRVDVADLVEQFDVSAVTIRQDLSALQDRGLLMRVRGGALPLSVLARELTLDEKVFSFSAVKDAIGRRAAELIHDGDSILLDSGTTTEALAYNFPSEPEVTVLTNGFNIARLLGQRENVDLIMTGGHLRRKSQSFYGPQAIKTLEHLRFNKLILGIDGMNMNFGLTTHFGPEALLNRHMLEVAQQCIVLSDSSKFGRYGMHHIASIERIDIMITDTGIPDKYANHLEQLGVRLIVADESMGTRAPRTGPAMPE